MLESDGDLHAPLTLNDKKNNNKMLVLNYMTSPVKDNIGLDMKDFFFSRKLQRPYGLREYGCFVNEYVWIFVTQSGTNNMQISKLNFFFEFRKN